MRYFAQLFGAVSLALAVAEGLANDAPDAAKKQSTPDECVFFSTLYDWRVLDDTNLVLWAPGKRDAYRVELTMPLMGMRFADALAFIDGNEDHRLCSYGRDAVGTDRGGAPAKSSIRTITRLNTEDIAKLEEKYKVNLSRDKKKKKIPPEPARETAQ